MSSILIPFIIKNFQSYHIDYNLFGVLIYDVELCLLLNLIPIQFWLPPSIGLISPPPPSFIPPKYLVTTTTTFRKSSFFITSNAGIPAVPEGSPSSLNL